MALILSRRSGETVMIDGCATITVYAKGNVKLHIEAPPEVHIVRGELKQKEEKDGGRLEQTGAS